MFVGDSLSLNMWESLSCMIHASVPSAKNTFERKDSISSVNFQVLSLIILRPWMRITFLCVNFFLLHDFIFVSLQLFFYLDMFINFIFICRFPLLLCFSFSIQFFSFLEGRVLHTSLLSTVIHVFFYYGVEDQWKILVGEIERLQRSTLFHPNFDTLISLFTWQTEKSVSQKNEAYIFFSHVGYIICFHVHFFYRHGRLQAVLSNQANLYHMWAGLLFNHA